MDNLLILTALVNILIVIIFDITLSTKMSINILNVNSNWVNFFLILLFIINASSYYINSRLASYYTVLFIKGQAEIDEEQEITESD